LYITLALTFAIVCVELCEEERHGVSLAGVSEVSAQGQQGFVTKYVLLLVPGRHRERRAPCTTHPGYNFNLKD